MVNAVLRQMDHMNVDGLCLEFVIVYQSSMIPRFKVVVEDIRMNESRQMMDRKLALQNRKRAAGMGKSTKAVPARGKNRSSIFPSRSLKKEFRQTLLP